MWNHGIMEWFGLEGNLNPTQTHACHGRDTSQAAPSPLQCGLEHFRGWTSFPGQAESYKIMKGSDLTVLPTHLFSSLAWILDGIEGEIKTWIEREQTHSNDTTDAQLGFEGQKSLGVWNFLLIWEKNLWFPQK